jgi:glycosyltransferase involved in cell wall biosynthesis
MAFKNPSLPERIVTMPNKTVAYILKGYPRISESFILNEIYLLETMGLDLHIFSVKKSDEKKSHQVVDSIEAPVDYLPEDASVTDSNFARWLWVNVPHFFPSHWRLFVKRPFAYLQTLFYVLFGLSLRISLGKSPTFKTTFMKDFMRSGYIALKVLEHKNIQHLHGHFCHGATTMTMLASHLTGIPYSFTAHAKDIYVPKLNPGGLLQTKIERAEFVTTCTDYNGQFLRSLSPQGTPIYTLYHGLDTKLFTPPLEEPVGVPTILSVGRFVEKKGFPYLIDACRILKEKGLSFKCRIIGQKDEQSELVESMIQEFGLEDTVTIEGGMTQDELKEAYANATIFALPCFIVDSGDRDGIPNVLAEAMASGRAVVSTNSSGIPEIVEHEVNGLLVPQKNALALAKALEYLLENPDSRAELGQAARATVCDMFDSETTTVFLKDLFNTCLTDYSEHQTKAVQLLSKTVENSPSIVSSAK